MEDFNAVPQLVIGLGSFQFTLNSETLLMSGVVSVLMIAFAWASTRKISILPGGYQTLAEVMVAAFEGLVNDALDEGNRHYFPLILTLFLFIWLSNMLGVIPFLSEPTKDLNTPLAYGVLGFVISHYAGIKTKGFKAYASEYFQPMPFMMPLNVIGELSKVVSISFRLFGNIMGGAIIIGVVGHLVYSLVLPPLLNAFFGLFVGTIQAFVFTMLTLVYISVQTK
jgi:F-type H+-transporting ATPase subunit a